MTTEAPSLPADTLGYAYNRGGLNNQKLALYGLFLRAFREGPRRVVLPDLVFFNQMTFVHPRVNISQGFQLGPLREFAARHDIEIVDMPPCGDEGGWDHFQYGRDFIPFAAIEGELTPESFTCEFFRSLVPNIIQSEALRRVRDMAFGDKGIEVVAQLRIERDWNFHTGHRLRPFVSNTEDNNPSFRGIIRKICNTAGLNAKRAYVVCDEAALPVSKTEIRETVAKEFGIELYWKSDFLPENDLNALSLLSLSCLDFEIARAAPSFVGLTRSTFSNMVSVETYARTRRPVEHHYIYNLAGPSLALRTDNGAFDVPTLAAISAEGREQFLFDVAETFRAAGEPEKALDAYLRCAANIGTDREEVYLSLYAAGQLKAQLRFPAAEVLGAFRQAIDLIPSRGEAAHAASRYCRRHRLHKEGYEFAAKAIALSAPVEGRKVEAWIYEHGLLDEYAVNAHWAGHHAESILACLEILKRSRNLPDGEYARVISNAKASLEKLAAGKPVPVVSPDGA